MNIQISVIVWTVICFCLFMLIMRNGIFRPVLKILDERKAKLEEARAKKETFAQIQREHEEKLASMRVEYIEQKREETKAEMAHIRADERKQTKKAQAECLERIDAYRLELEREHEQMVAVIRPQMKEAAGIFARNIISHKG